MIKKIFASAFIIFYILCLPLYSYASTLTYNKFMKLTASGVAKVVPRAATIGLGVWAARCLMGMSAVGLVLQVGMGIYSLYELYKDATIIDVPVPATSPANLPTGGASTGSANRSQDWGRAVGPPFLSEQYGYTNSNTSLTLCAGGSNTVLNGWMWTRTQYNPIPDNYFVCGGYTWSTFHSCGAPTLLKISETRYVYYELVPSPFGGGVSISEKESEIPGATRSQIQSELAQARAIAEAAMKANPINENYYRPYLNKIIEAQDALKPIELGPGDYTTIGVAPADRTFPEGGDPDIFAPPPTAPSPTEPPLEGVPPIPDNACVEYQRVKHFDYSSLLQSAQAVPLLGLLSKLVFNPASQQFDGKITFHLSKFGAQEIDLNKWHYSDAIAIFRFVIIGGAFLTAIRIIYD